MMQRVARACSACVWEEHCFLGTTFAFRARNTAPFPPSLPGNITISCPAPSAGQHQSRHYSQQHSGHRCRHPGVGVMRSTPPAAPPSSPPVAPLDWTIETLRRSWGHYRHHYHHRRRHRHRHVRPCSAVVPVPSHRYFFGLRPATTAKVAKKKKRGVTRHSQTCTRRN